MTTAYVDQRVSAPELLQAPLVFADSLDCTVQVFSKPEDLAPLAAQWRQLEHTARAPSIFTSFAWADHVVRHFAGKASFDAVIVTVRMSGQLVALWPLARQRRGRLRVLTSIGAPFDQYSEALIANGIDAEPLLATMVAALRRDASADGMILRKAKTSGDVFRYAAQKAYVVDEGAEAPQVEFDPNMPFSQFMSTVKVKTRKNLRNYSNRLARLGTVEHKVFEGGDVGKVLSQSFDERRSWLDEKGLSSEAFRDKRFNTVVRNERLLRLPRLIAM